MYCIVVTGIPAAGKTTIASYLSKQLNLPMISKDSIKEVMFEEIGFQSREEKVKLGVASMNVMYYFAEQMMKNNSSFILENNFENNSREGITKLLEKYGYTAITIMLTGDYRSIYERFLLRNMSEERHRGHVVNDCYPEKEKGREIKQITYEDYVNSVVTRGMDSFVANGPKITLDSTNIAEIDREGLMRELMEQIEHI